MVAAVLNAGNQYAACASALEPGAHRQTPFRNWRCRFACRRPHTRQSDKTRIDRHSMQAREVYATQSHVEGFQLYGQPIARSGRGRLRQSERETQISRCWSAVRSGQQEGRDDAIASIGGRFHVVRARIGQVGR